MNREARGRFGSMLRAAAPLGVLLTFGTWAHAAVTITPGSGASTVTRQATGIYSVANVNKAGTTYTTLILFNKGSALEAHAQRPGGWLAKKSGNSKKVLSTATFQELIHIAGLNQNVETLPAAKKTQFYQVAGLSGTTAPSAPPPAEVPPGPDKKCPPGYELKLKKPAGGQATFTCQALSHWLDGIAAQRLASLWNSLALIPPAEAFTSTRFQFKVGSFSFFDAVHVTDDAGNEYFGINVLGLLAEFFIPPGG